MNVPWVATGSATDPCCCEEPCEPCEATSAVVEFDGVVACPCDIAEGIPDIVDASLGTVTLTGPSPNFLNSNTGSVSAYVDSLCADHVDDPVPGDFAVALDLVCEEGEVVSWRLVAVGGGTNEFGTWAGVFFDASGLGAPPVGTPINNELDCTSGDYGGHGTATITFLCE